MNRWIGNLAWAWVIIIGGMMITPGVIECIVCGRIGTIAIGIISVALGVAAFVSNKQKTAGR